ncbi:MAG TPA: hypothetical protein VHA11_02470 [Bryobacteraceae bacterium]|nr:hypothetical protein [Bryobacteraceae bacterium]
MSRAHAAAEMGLWNAESSPVLIEYSVPVLEQIRAEAVSGFCRFPRGGIEIGGILFGSAEGNRIRVLAARQVACEYASGPSYVLSDRDHARFRTTLEAPRSDRDLAGMVPVGWYHSHTRSGIFLSPADLEIQDRYFPNRRQVALVVKPEATGPGRAGFFVREGNGSIQAGASYQEFAIPVLNPRAHVAEPPEPVDPPQPPAAELETAAPDTAVEAPPEPEEDAAVLPDEPEPAIEEIEEEEDERAPRGGMHWVWAGLAVMVALAVFAFLPRQPRHDPAPLPLSLRVLDASGQLQIAWDRNSLRGAGVRRASIEIVDGGERVLMPFDAERLREGSITYARHSDNVEVRLRVERASGSQEEFVRFLGSRIDSAATPLPATPVPLPASVSKPVVSPERMPEETPRLGGPAVPKAQPKAFDMAQLRTPERPRREVALPAPPAVEPSGGRPVLSGPPVPGSEPRIAPPPAQPARENRPKPAYTGPSSGRILWTGDFRRGVSNSLEGRHATAGAPLGELPGLPVRVRAYPAELSARGLTVFASGGRDRREGPGPQNGWNNTSWMVDPRRSGELLVLEPPSPQNGWKKLTVRNDSRDLSIIIIDWSLVE